MVLEDSGLLTSRPRLNSDLWKAEPVLSSTKNAEPGLEASLLT